MNQEDASTLAAVARRIGYQRIEVITGVGEPFAGYRDSAGYVEFNPITNPADERMVRQWWLREAPGKNSIWSDGDMVILECEGIEVATAEAVGCEQMALCRAVAALPEAVE